MTEKIDGYRELSEAEIKLINAIKKAGNDLGILVEELGDDLNADQRWVSIGNTQLQQGIMALVRSVARPENF